MRQCHKREHSWGRCCCVRGIRWLCCRRSKLQRKGKQFVKHRFVKWSKGKQYDLSHIVSSEVQNTSRFVRMSIESARLTVLFIYRKQNQVKEELLYSLVQWNWFSVVTGCTWVTCISDVREPTSLHHAVCLHHRGHGSLQGAWTSKDVCSTLGQPSGFCDHPTKKNEKQGEKREREAS